MTSIYEGKFKITQRYKGADHKGLDEVGLTNKNIHSPIVGKVVAARKDPYPDGGMGNYIKIQAADNGYFWLFAHLSAFKVNVGDVVEKGTLIGIEGNTGHSFGSHCHIEVRQNASSNSFVNVANLLGIVNAEGHYEVPVAPKHSLDYLAVQDKYGFSDETMTYLNKYDYAEDLLKKMLQPIGVQKYQLETIQYILGYKYGLEIFNKLK